MSDLSDEEMDMDWRPDEPVSAEAGSAPEEVFLNWRKHKFNPIAGSKMCADCPYRAGAAIHQFKPSDASAEAGSGEPHCEDTFLGPECALKPGHGGFHRALAEPQGRPDGLSWSEWKTHKITEHQAEIAALKADNQRLIAERDGFENGLKIAQGIIKDYEEKEAADRAEKGK